MSHSTSLRATGSKMLASISLALLVAPRRTFSIALLTSAMSPSEVSGVGACTRGVCGGSAGPLAPSAGVNPIAMAGGESGRADGRGTAVVFDDFELLSFDRSAAALLRLDRALLPVAFAVAT